MSYPPSQSLRRSPKLVQMKTSCWRNSRRRRKRSTKMAGEWRRGIADPKCTIAHARLCVQGCLWVCPNSSVASMGTTIASAAAVVCSTPQHHSNTRILLSLPLPPPPPPPWSGNGWVTAPHCTAPQCQACPDWSLALWSTLSSRPMEGRL